MSPALAGGFFTTEPQAKLHSRILAWEISWTEDPGGLKPTYKGYNMIFLLCLTSISVMISSGKAYF